MSRAVILGILFMFLLSKGYAAEQTVDSIVWGFFEDVNPYLAGVFFIVFFMGLAAFSGIPTRESIAVLIPAALWVGAMFIGWLTTLVILLASAGVAYAIARWVR
jgi:hypothetical protein